MLDSELYIVNVPFVLAILVIGSTTKIKGHIFELKFFGYYLAKI